MDNLYAVPPAMRREADEEVFEPLLSGQGRFRLERIVSWGQATPEGQWYDQDGDEWVLLAEGRAGLVFEDGQEVVLNRGDSLFLQRRRKHRVAWTSKPCIWLALHADGMVMPPA